jgi:hypothetical protein
MWHRMPNWPPIPPLAPINPHNPRHRACLIRLRYLQGRLQGYNKETGEFEVFLPHVTKLGKVDMVNSSAHRGGSLKAQAAAE